ncbi:MAG TPA: methionine--tRNA ligase [Kofleriaceae bacterium]|jgi:methionyl-tRNA synthetase
MTTPFYITTPIYYVNDVPHLGHAYTTTVADTLARFHRMRGDDTRFLTGTDEHGQKIEEAATKRGLTPQQLVDQVAPRFDEAWKALGIENYRFIRTTDAKHKLVVANLWKRIRERNPDDIYLETYQGWYCISCESFYTESQLVKEGEQWLCAIHKRPVSWIDKERSWFFRLSKYTKPLLDHIAANPEFIRPTAYKNEIVSFLEKEGLRDLSISRTSFSWGIPAPEPDPEGKQHVIYVWMDALTNYYSDLVEADGNLDGATAKKYFPEAVHLIGKDILRFHAVYWPAFLMAAQLPLPKSILAHGWWTVRGEKISKSMPATRIDPLVLSDALAVGPLGRPLGIDAMRYYLLREVPLGNDGDFTFESLFGRFNAELANDLGNLVNRAMTMINKFAPEFPPKRDDALFAAGENPYWQIETNAFQAVGHVEKELLACAPSRALEALWRFVGQANRFIDQTQPWTMAKAKDPALPHALWCLQTSLWLIARMVAPVLPATSRTLLEWLGDTGPATWPVGHEGRVLTQAPALTSIAPPAALFPRLDDAMQAQILTKVAGDAVAPTAAAAAPAKETKPKADKAVDVPAAAGALITYDDFAKLELRTGKVLSAVKVPKKDKLLHLQVDLGEAKPRSIVAGIAEVFTAEAVVGKQVIVVANLAPRKMAGLVSEGMILAAGDEAILGLSAIDADVPPGTRVR